MSTDETPIPIINLVPRPILPPTTRGSRHPFLQTLSHGSRPVPPPILSLGPRPVSPPIPSEYNDESPRSEEDIPEPPRLGLGFRKEKPKIEFDVTKAYAIDFGTSLVKYGKLNDTLPKTSVNVETKTQGWVPSETSGENAFKKWIEGPKSEHNKVDIVTSCNKRFPIQIDLFGDKDLEADEMNQVNHTPCYFVKPNSIDYDENPYNKLLNIRNFQVESAIVVDLGHSSTWLYAIKGGVEVHKRYSQLSGTGITGLLSTLLIRNQRKMTFANDKAVWDLGGVGRQIMTNLIKNAEAKVALDISDIFVSWESFVTSLASENTYLSLLPAPCLQEIINFCKWNKTKSSDAVNAYTIPLTPLQQLQWTLKIADPVKEGENQLVKYEIGYESYFVMEALFNTKIQELCLNISKPVTLPDEIIQMRLAHPEIKTLILTGGMANCPGLVERLKKELKEHTFEIVVDEFFMWKAIAKNTENEALMPARPPPVG